MKTCFYFTLLISIVILTALCAAAQVSKIVTVIVADGKDREICRFQTELAMTPEKRAQGLMFRASMRQRTGMLFVHADDGMQYFWMKDTYIPLDIIFINSRFEVVHVHHNARPRDEKTITSHYPAMYVLEVNAGEAKACSIKRGTKVKLNGYVPER